MSVGREVSKKSAFATSFDLSTKFCEYEQVYKMSKI